ncbi:carboxypeptidase-like regulatory domain-containing protein [Winogradskyella sp. UBA3174]|uniref:carboxypeptidase-like regulatory domain-containing protein n=1 Tax=Winogradskyella sp. UBA3174 TaxID=1947785 RepID=UPI0025DB0300|nr:carboxypeptidase-like regulatory domain-containing protein [Winogradskyella sp. UBA3174]|tara:strand:- start:18098 stop:19114 length:1017 start_codon:yes stop_codon:yes gene_type:complete
MINKICLLLFVLTQISFSQMLTGLVVDKETNQPLETAAVYFDNTTTGTTTDENGKFSITYSDAIQSTLVISYLGYEKVFISDYRTKTDITIQLVEATNSLEEVYIDYDDGLTRKQKLRLFRTEFLGTSKFAKTCKILNEDDLILRYDKRNKALYVSSKVPIRVKNRALQYEIAYDILDFEVIYRYLNTSTLEFTMYSVTYLGTNFYKDLEKGNRNKTLKNREKAYKGSVQHFIRALYNKNLENQGYLIFYDKFRVNEWSYFNVEDIVESNLKKVNLKTKVSILYKMDFQSELQLKVDHFFIDVYGNYSPIIGVYFSGYLGSQRVGDTLPSNYGLNTKK